MSVSTPGIILGRVKASSEAGMAIFKAVKAGGLDCVFADTVETQKRIRGCDSRYLFTLDGTMSDSVILSKLEGALK